MAAPVASTVALAGANIPPKPLVRLRGVDKVYDSGTVALQDLNLDIAPNEFVSLLGPSGCGKSTALRIIAGLGGYSAGAIDWPTSTYDARGEPEREIGFVFQEPQPMPWATITDNVRLPLKLKKVPRAEATRSGARVLDLVGLASFADAYPRQLSGGMKMRASIARALVTEPKMPLMDAGRSPRSTRSRAIACPTTCSTSARSRCTVLFVTHSVYESVFLSNRIVAMAPRPGRVASSDAPAPYPRDAGWRQSADYAACCREVSALLAVATVQRSWPPCRKVAFDDAARAPAHLYRRGRQAGSIAAGGRAAELSPLGDHGRYWRSRTYWACRCSIVRADGSSPPPRARCSSAMCARALKGMTIARAQIEELLGAAPRRGDDRPDERARRSTSRRAPSPSFFTETNPRVEVRLKLMTTGDQILTAASRRARSTLGIGFDFPRHTTIRVAHSVGRLGAACGAWIIRWRARARSGWPPASPILLAPA